METIFNEKLVDHIRKKVEAKEKAGLHPKGAFSSAHHRFNEEDEDYRLAYRRDVDKIVHSKAYSRYVDKTQVVYLLDNDHISHRSLHVQLVSQFARGIGEILCLNPDLIEAVALGHDVGHPPFGHEGESYLSELSVEYGNGIFAHPLQSCRLLTVIEKLNLGLMVYDGFLCHDGGMQSAKLTPLFGKCWDDHSADKQKKLKDPEFNIMPATLEGCLVKICDTMSYIARDIEDAIKLNIISREQLPKTILGNNSKQILKTLAEDLIQNSFSQDYIALSEEAFEALKQMRKFNFQYIYFDSKLKKESHKIKLGYRILFNYLLEDYDQKKHDSYLFNHFIHNKTDAYIEGTKPVQMVVDFIAGMTDNYFIRTFEKLIVPSKTELL